MTWGTLPAAVKLIVGVAVAGLLVVVGEWELGRVVRKNVRDEVKLARLDSVRVVHDASYNVDTLKLRTINNTIYKPLRDSARANKTDTVLVERALAAADSTIQQCYVVIKSCEQRVADRDAIIAELRKPKLTRRLTFPGEILYDPFRAEAAVRAGAELRLFWGFSAKAEAEARQGPTSGTQGALRVGLRKTF